MAETPEEAEKAPETTPAREWLLPNQDKLEQVIDARLAAHAANEKADKKTSSRSRSTSSSSDDKAADGKTDDSKS